MRQHGDFNDTHASAFHVSTRWAISWRPLQHVIHGTEYPLPELSTSKMSGTPYWGPYPSGNQHSCLPRQHCPVACIGPLQGVYRLSPQSRPRDGIQCPRAHPRLRHVAERRSLAGLSTTLLEDLQSAQPKCALKPTLYLLQLDPPTARTSLAWIGTIVWANVAVESYCISLITYVVLSTVCCATQDI